MVSVAATVAAIAGFAGNEVRGQAVQPDLGAYPRDGAVMVIYDSSNSMWGEVGSNRKYEVARNNFGHMIDQFAADGVDLDLGLTVFGHRAKKDCADIERVVTPRSLADPAHRAALKRAVQQLEPNGNTPIAAALEFAADGLRYTEQRATIILISDGIETCEGDPCAVADKLERLGVAFTAHLVGFDLKQEDFEKLRCVAERTGGQAILANDAPALSRALVRLNEQIRREEAARRGGFVRFAIVDPLNSDVESTRLPPASHILIRPRGEAGVVSRRLEPAEWELPTPLQAGAYVATLNVGAVSKPLDLFLEPSQTTSLVFQLDDGNVVARVLNPSDGSQVPAALVDWRVVEAWGKQPESVMKSGVNPLELDMPFGPYRIAATVGEETLETTLTVAPGKERRVDLVMSSGLGRLLLRTGTVAPDVFANLDPPVAFELYSLGGRSERLVTRGQGGFEGNLPKGRYRAVASLAGSVKELEFEILADSTVVTEILFGPGRVLGHSVGGDGRRHDSRGILWTIRPIEGAGVLGAPHELRDSLIDLTLPPGRYRLEAVLFGVHESKEVEIDAEKTTTVKMLMILPR